MSQNWMRHFELLLADGKGDGINISGLKVHFTIQKMPATLFNGFVGNFKVYNLSPATRSRIMRNEFSRIQVMAGYKGLPDDAGNYPDENIGMIFNGDIRFTITGKDNMTDIWVLLQCIDSWEGHLNARVKTTVAAGWKYHDLFSLGMQSFGPYGIGSGAVPPMPETVFPRGRVVYQNTARLMNHLAGQCNANWWYENNQVNIVPEDNYIGVATVLNANTGLIGMPQQTMGAGVNVRCLINPNIKLGGLIRLDQKAVYRKALPNEQIATSQVRLRETKTGGNLYVDGLPGMSQPYSINTEGDYIVGSIDYTGDTRGQAWYMDLLCLARGSGSLLTPDAIAKTEGVSDV